MTKCQNCGQECKEILHLGDQPLCNANLHSKKEFKTEKRYPLGMVFCPACYLVQQPIRLPTSLVFSAEYNYLSSSSTTVVAHYTRLAKKYKFKYNLIKKDLVLDIASNDGVFLKPLKEAGVQVLGVDPAPLPASIAISQGVPTIVSEFESAKLPYLRNLKLITAFDVLAHTGSIHSMLDRIANLMRINANAVFISQSHYLPRLMEGNEWDTLYHEHARFYTLASLQNLFAAHGLHVYDAELNDFYGGSFIAYASTSFKHQSTRLLKLLNAEAKYKDYATYKGFAKKVQASRTAILKALAAEKKAGKKLFAIGCPMKASVLLNYCNIGPETLDFITEKNKLKIHTFSPGMHIQVIDEDLLLNIPPRLDITGLILSWNMKDAIMKNMRAKRYKGSFIIPLPTLEVIK